jgi:acetyltransferase-like isoleucine patch superfamily enzyme
MSALKFAAGLFRRLRTSWELRRYTPYTKAEYFRRLGAQIGEGCYIVPDQLGTEPYLVRIGRHVAIATGVIFMTHDGGAWLFRDEAPDLQAYGPIVIGDNCLIGQGAVLGPNIRIGSNSVVAALSLVISDVPPNSVVLGVPARPFGSLEKYRERCLTRWASQKPSGVEIRPGETWWNARNFRTNRQLLQEHLVALFHDDLA